MRPLQSPTCCKKCGQQIFWAKLRNGDRLPLDIEPTALGTYIVNDKDEVTGLGGGGHKRHDSTCPGKKRAARCP